MMENKIDRFEVQWVCALCGGENVDYFNLTFSPICGDCLKDWYWWDILSDEQIDNMPEEYTEQGL